MTDLECHACKREFNASVRVPHVFPSCGHTFCRLCITEWLRGNDLQVRCPEDNGVFAREETPLTIVDFPENVFVTRMLVRRSSDLFACESLGPDVCALHQKAVELVCLTDRSLLCVDCVLFGAHKNHDYEREEAFGKRVKAKVTLAQTKRAAFERDLRSFLDQRLPGAQAALRKKERALGAELASVFETARAALTAHEQALSEKLREKFVGFGAALRGTGQRTRRLLEEQDALEARLARLEQRDTFAELTQPAVLEALFGDAKLDREQASTQEDLQSLEKELEALFVDEVEALRVESCMADALKTFEGAVRVLASVQPVFNLPPISRRPSNPEYTLRREAGKPAALHVLDSQESLSDSELTLTKHLLNSKDDLFAGEGAASPRPTKPVPTKRSLHEPRKARTLPHNQLDPSLSLAGVFSPHTSQCSAVEDTGRSKQNASQVMFRLLRQETAPTLLGPRQTAGFDSMPSSLLGSFVPATPKKGSFLKAQAAEGAVVMNLDGARLSDTKLSAVLGEVMRNRSLRMLVLDRNSITESGFAELLRRLGTHPSLESVSLVENMLDDSVFALLDEHARVPRRLRHFNLRGNRHFRNAMKIKREAANLKRKGLTIEL